MKNKLAKGIFKNIDCALQLYLAPSFTNNVSKGIDSHLNQMLMKYNSQVKGVILAYDNIRREDPEMSRILPDSPFLEVSITVTFLVFAPKVGCKLVGTVNKQSSDHMGLLCFGFFNASISKLHIANGMFHWNEDESEWTVSASGTSIRVGDEIDFTLLDTNVSNGVLSLIGSLDLVQDVASPVAALEDSTSKRKKKKEAAAEGDETTKVEKVKKKKRSSDKEESSKKKRKSDASE